MRDYPQVGELASQARQRLAAFTGLHMTPPEWLHMTTHVAGPADQFTDQQIQHMTASGIREPGQRSASHRQPRQDPLSPRSDHARRDAPVGDLTPIRAAALAATKAVASLETDEESGWTPHVTLCYSTVQQPAQPVITALGKQLPARQIDIDTMSLVIQDGPERDWNWTTVGTIRLHATALA